MLSLFVHGLIDCRNLRGSSRRLLRTLGKTSTTMTTTTAVTMITTTTTTSGHLKILFLNIVQYVMDVPKAIRSQIDYVFALREPQRAYRENLYKNFFGIFPTYDEFSAAFDACTA